MSRAILELDKLQVLYRAGVRVYCNGEKMERVFEIDLSAPSVSYYTPGPDGLPFIADRDAPDAVMMVHCTERFGSVEFVRETDL